MEHRLDSIVGQRLNIGPQAVFHWETIARVYTQCTSFNKHKRIALSPRKKVYQSGLRYQLTGDSDHPYIFGLTRILNLIFDLRYVALFSSATFT